MINNSLNTKYQRIDEHISQVTGSSAKCSLFELHHVKQMTILGMSKHLGLSRSSIERALERHCVPKRSYDHSSYMKEWYKKHPGAGAILTKNAHRAVRGSRQSDDTLIKRALTIQEKAKLSKLESFVLKYFNSNGLYPVPLYAVYKFNIDLAFPRNKLAIEVHGGNFHTSPKKIAQDKVKSKYLKSIGWDMVIIEQGAVKIKSAEMQQLLLTAIKEIETKLEPCSGA